MTDLHAILSGWMRLCHAGARRRNAVDFMCAADMHDLWRWAQANA